MASGVPSNAVTCFCSSTRASARSALLPPADLPRLLGQPLGGVIRKSARGHRYWLFIRTSSKDGKSDIGTRLIV